MIGAMLFGLAGPSARPAAAWATRTLRVLAALSASLSSASCGGKTHSDTPGSSSNQGGMGGTHSNPGGAGGASTLERHRLIAKAGPRASSPDATWRSDRLGVVY